MREVVQPLSFNFLLKSNEMKNTILNIKQSLALLVVIFAVGLISKISAQQQNFLTVKGNKLYDVQGKEVRLTGVNWFGFETQNYFPHGIWSRDMKSVLQQIKDLGFNTIRVPWANEMLNPGSTIAINSYGTDPYTGISPMNEEETKVTKPIELMDIFVKWCQENDMKIVLDNHSRAADGFLNEEVWYTPEYSEERWIKDWVFIADRYKDYSAVVAMDLNNEPHGSSWGNSNPATDWNKAAERCGNAVLKANPNVLIIIEGVGEFEGNSYWWGGQLMGARKYPIQLSDPSKLMYSAHEYGPEVAQQDWFTAADFPQNMPQIWKDNYHYLYEEETSPLFVGEFGIKEQDAFGGIAYTWFTEFTDFMGDIYSWTFWSMNPNSGDTGGILQDDWTSVNQWKLDVLKTHFAPLIPNVVGGSNPTVNGGTIAGGPFVFTVGDGIADNVSGVTITGTVGDTNQWIVTDAQGKILGLPARPEDVDFDGAGVGSCFIYNVTYNGTISGLAANQNISGLSGTFDLSNRIEVVRNAVVVTDGGTVATDGGLTAVTTITGDGIADVIVFTNTSAATANYIYLITDEAGKVLTTETTSHDFEGVSVGICKVYGLSYTGTLNVIGKNVTATDLSDGSFSVSTNSIVVTREEQGTTVNGGVIAGGPFTFTVGDGIADNVSGVTLTGTVGETNQWIVTDAQGKILGLPPTPEAVDFDGAGVGSCFIYNVTYNGAITGLAADALISALNGDFDLSNSIEVIRIPVSSGGDCSFGAPLANALPTIGNVSYNDVHVLGTGGPDLSNVTNFTINWDLANNGLWQLSMNTNNGAPSWWVNLLSNITTQNFNAAQPSITLSGTGFSNLDGSYYATQDGDNFALVSIGGGFTIYFSNSATAPVCEDAPKGQIVEGLTVKALTNPVQDKLVIRGNDFLDGTAVNIVNIAGKVMKTMQVQSKVKEIELNTSDLPIGIYFVQFNSLKGNIQTMKIAKM
ncbi:T9SS C-terminal target domain-containing protein [Aquimarina sp. AD10]|nr:T9SS C-terminal target domain-containing protein [Aquimarina sp. AD10]RKM91348.1 T9SS C-terminal target domain-containing protein [Aquimarina sp. AD10]